MDCATQFIGGKDIGCEDRRQNGKGSFTCYCKSSKCNTLEFLEQQKQTAPGKPNGHNFVCFQGNNQPKGCGYVSSCVMSIEFKDEKLMTPKTYG